MSEPWTLFLTCEHGGNAIPAAYRRYLSPEVEALLPTHRGWDQGALEIARALGKSLGCSLHVHEVSRLLIDCNRSIHHGSCYGPSFREIDKEAKDEIARLYYFPYREAVANDIARAVKAKKKVLHCAMHSFTPVMNGEERNADFGLLYDPSRSSEKVWADRLMRGLQSWDDWRVRRNYPYLGKSDGFTRYLRKTFPVSRYAGFEFEFNQRCLQTPAAVDSMGQRMLQLFQSQGLSYEKL